MSTVNVTRLAWHAGFGGTGTVETLHPAQFLVTLREKYGHLDFVDAYGGYRVPEDDLPPDLDVIRNGRPHSED